MRKQPVLLDPLSLTRIGMATWMTQQAVARKIAEAVTQQNALIARTIRDGLPL
jgi:hypothetical protein